MNDPKRANKLLLGLGLVLGIFLAGIFVYRWLRSESTYQGKPTSYWVQKALKGDHSQKTLEALSAIGPEAVVPLLKAIKQPDSSWKSHYMALYPKLPGLCQRLLPQPTADADIRDRAYLILNRISDFIKGPRAAVLLPTLVPLLSDDDPRPSRFVDANTHVALPNGEFVRSIAASVLGSIGPDAEPAVPALIAALNDAQWKGHNHYLIPRALGKIGPRAQSAIPALREVFERGEANVAVWAAEALWRIDSSQAPVASQILEKALSQTNRLTRVKAARVHWSMTRQPSITIPVLLDLMRDPENHWLIDTMRALEDIGPEAAEAIPMLREKLSDKDEVIRQVAAEVLSKIDRTAARSRAR